MRKAGIFMGLLACASGISHSQGNWVDVWNGRDSTGLYKFGSGNVAFTNGVIRLSNGSQGGYFATTKEYTHYRTKFEWNNPGGNTGFLFHIGQDRVWPLGLECQTMSGDVGSLWTTGCMFTSMGTKSGTGGTYNPTGPVITGVGTTGTSRSNFKKPANVNPYLGDGQWNTFEILVKGDSIEIKINNTVTMRAWAITINNGTPLTRGKIALQNEGATVDFRNWQVMDLSGANPIFLPHNHKPMAARLGFGYDATPLFYWGNAEDRVFLLNGRTLPALPLKAPIPQKPR